MSTTLRFLMISITLCAFPSFASAVDHSAELFPQLGHSDSVWAVAFSPDGTTLVSDSRDTLGRGDNTLKLWDVATCKLLATLEGPSGSRCA